MQLLQNVLPNFGLYRIPALFLLQMLHRLFCVNIATNMRATFCHQTSFPLLTQTVSEDSIIQSCTDQETLEEFVIHALRCLFDREDGELRRMLEGK